MDLRSHRLKISGQEDKKNMKTDAGWYTDVIINIKYTLQRHGGVVVVVVVGGEGCLKNFSF